VAENRPRATQLAQEKLRKVTVEELSEKFEEYLFQAQTRKDEAKKRGDESAVSRYLQHEDAIFAEIQLLKKFSKKFQPFKSPYYWAGFICQGLR
jgi:CHAT domain-containing protein